LKNDFLGYPIGKVATGVYIRWVNVQAIDVKFSQDLTHQKSLKSVAFWQSCLKNKTVEVFLGHGVYNVTETLFFSIFQNKNYVYK